MSRSRISRERWWDGLSVPATLAGMGIALILALGSCAGSPPPGSAAIASVQPATASPSAAASPSGSPAPAVSRPAPPGPGEPWGGLIWSEPMAADLPWAYTPDQILYWRGEYIAIDITDAASSGEVVVASSTDLQGWTVLARGAAAPFADGQRGKLLIGPQGLVAIGPFWCADLCPVAKVWTSDDGAAWAGHEGLPFGDSLIDADAGPKGLVALGSRGWHKPVMWYSPAGLSWQEVKISGPVFKDADVSHVRAIPGGFVATGSVGGNPLPPGAIGDVNSTPAAWWSTDGLTWTRSGVDGTEQAIALGPVQVTPHGLLAIGAGEWSSTDGRSWRPLPSSDPLTADSIWSDGIRMVSYRYGDPDVGVELGQFSESLDGITWRLLQSTGYPGVWEWECIFVTSDGLIGIAKLQADSEPVVLRATATPARNTN